MNKYLITSMKIPTTVANDEVIKAIKTELSKLKLTSVEKPDKRIVNKIMEVNMQRKIKVL